MSSRFGTRTYGKPTKVCQASIQFEKVFTDKNNRPSAAKSTGILHKWGKTSFTSMRNNHLNGQKTVEEQVKRPKLALEEEEEDPFSFEPEAAPSHPGTKAASKATSAVAKPAVPAKARPNKFFKSGNRGSSAAGNKTSSNPRCQPEPCFPSTGSTLSEISFDTLNIQLPNKELLNTTLESTTLGPLISRTSSPKAFSCNSSSYGTSDERDMLDSISPTPDENDPFSQGLTSSVSKISGPEIAGNQLLDSKQEDQFFRTYSFSSSAEDPSTVLASPLVSLDIVDSSESKDQPGLKFGEGNGVGPECESDVSNHSIFLKSDTCTSVDETGEHMLSLNQSNFDITPDLSDVSNHSKEDIDMTISNHVTNFPRESPPPPKEEASQSTHTFIDDIAAEIASADDIYVDEKAVIEKESYVTSTQKASGTIPKKEVLPVRTRRIFNSPKKIDKKALYKHRPWQADDEEAQESKEIAAAETKSLIDEFEDEEAVIAPLTRVVTWPTRVGDEAVTSIQCSRRAKNFYTVVRNVKKAHQCHESGETQEFNDDIEYLLDGLQSTIPTSTRCLSVLSLAAKCMVPGFRMHLRAHGTISKVFSALSDAPSDQNMSLCTATVMFILSQDRLNMDLERSSLELMLQLLESDFEHCSELACDNVLSAIDDKSKRELDWSKNKVHELCEEVQKKGHARHLNLENITAATLAMESLLSLTSRRAGEWFKEELRNLGGLDHIVDTIDDCVSCLGQDLDEDDTCTADLKLERICKIDRCLRVVESVTLMNSENQVYLIKYKNCQLVTSIARVLQWCATALVQLAAVFDMSDKESTGYVLFNCMQSVLKVLLNITNNNTLGSSRVGEEEEFFEVALKCIFHIPRIIPNHQLFDLHVLTLGLVINLVENCSTNCQRIIDAGIPPHHEESERVPSVRLLVNLYLEKEEQARQEEAKTNSLLDGEKQQDEEEDKEAESTTTTTPQTAQDELENTLTKALQKAGKHMEASIVAAYIAILLGCIVKEMKDQAKEIKLQLPGNDFSSMLQILKRFLNFMNLTGTVGNSALNSIQRVIDVLESS